eukprot:2898896-Prymnesium_polylepis.2
MGWFFTAVGGSRTLACDPIHVYMNTTLDSTSPFLTARRQRTGAITQGRIHEYDREGVNCERKMS